MRTGANGLYPGWLTQEPGRNWDLFLSTYIPMPAHPAAIATEMGGYNKLEHFRDCVLSGSLDLSPYRLVLLADDDLDVTGGSISAFFESADRLGLTVSHPAQDWSGYWSLRIMLRNPLAEWRETNFVEIMCPCFDTAFLARKLADYALRLYASPAYLAQHGVPQRPADLAGTHRLVGYIPDMIYAPELRYLDEFHPGLAPQLRSSSINAQHRLIAAGAGIGALPPVVAHGAQQELLRMVVGLAGCGNERPAWRS